MRCPECNSSKKINLKGKHYCADCGHRLEEPSKAVATITGSAKAPITKAKKAPKPHLLDLSRPTSKHKPSQTIHGVRRSQPLHQAVHKSTSVSQHTHHEVTVAKRHSRRAQHAQQIPRSPRVAKFSALADAADSPPVEQPAKPPVLLTPHETYMVNQKVVQADQSAAIAMHHQRAPQSQATETLVESDNSQVSPNLVAKLRSLFQPAPRFAMSASIALSVLVMAGYIAYLNYPNMALRIAANRAGIDANLPNYTPSGYSFGGPLQYESGKITMRFNSNSDAGFINLSQSKTNWDSASLLENYVLQKSRDYITFQQNGLTIYMYSGNNAAWVNGGVLYTIEGNNFLNSEQIIKMASSL